MRCFLFCLRRIIITRARQERCILRSIISFHCRPGVVDYTVQYLSNARHVVYQNKKK
jgi:hypothetical protein